MPSPSSKLRGAVARRFRPTATSCPPAPSTAAIALLGLVTSQAAVWGCQSQAGAAARGERNIPQSKWRHEEETHFKGLLQLTDGGENAEAYWSFANDRLILQAHEGQGCDQIYTMDVSGPLPERTLVSTGKGATTCAYFLPGDQEIIYSSTHLGGEECPPKPDHSKGYVWPLYESFDIFRANADGSGLRPITSEPGYDAEATVCPVDGSIVFTSVRDGDLELYRMDADGQNVQRLTHTPGYDGGAFFNEDCTKIVWRASRPTGEALKDFNQLLSEGLVRPSKLEIFVADADGSNAAQVTHLGAAAFGPFFAPGSKRILFSTNAGDPKGREFDIWAVNVDGTQLEQITHTPGFDGFPMFSHDGKYLAFASNRASRPGTYDTNVFVTEWVDHEPAPSPLDAISRIGKDIEWLADPAREGRGVGTEGLVAAGAYIEARLKELGLEPAVDGSFRQELEVVTDVKSGSGTSLKVAGTPLAAGAFQPLGFSATGSASGALVLAGYGIEDDDKGIHEYGKRNVEGKIAVVRRFAPDSEAIVEEADKRRFSDLRYKAWVARERGAKALIVVDAPLPPGGAGKDWKAPDEAKFPELHRSGYGDAGLPVVIVQRAAFAEALKRLEKGQRVEAALAVELSLEKTSVFNVLAKLPAAEEGKLPGAIVVGAHYDHLGYGGPNSLAPGDSSPHVGADDNASGVALVLEVAREMKARGGGRRDVIFAAFTAEEMGALGSTHLVNNPPAGLEPKEVWAMLNFDMVGRLSRNTVSILGGESALEWATIVPQACEATQLECTLSGSGYGPSDHSAFYGAGVPVLHFFTGAHSDYHKPSDQADRINALGVARIADLTERVLLAAPEQKLTYNKLPPEQPQGDMRSFNASLGSIPDYAGPPDGKKGVLLSGVRPGSGADLAGMQRGDILVKLGDRQIDSVHDLMYALNAAKPNQTVKAIVERAGKPVALTVTYQERGQVRGNPHGPAKDEAAQGASPHAAPSPHGSSDAPAHGEPGAHGTPAHDPHGAAGSSPPASARAHGSSPSGQ